MFAFGGRFVTTTRWLGIRYCLPGRKFRILSDLESSQGFLRFRITQRLDQGAGSAVICGCVKEARHKPESSFERVARSWPTPLFLSSPLLSARLVRSLPSALASCSSKLKLQAP